MKILKEQDPTAFRSMHVEREAIDALQKSAEKHLLSVLEGMYSILLLYWIDTYLS